MKKQKLSLAALGLSAVLAAGPAAAAISWNPNGIVTTFQDNDIDAIFDSNLNPKPGGLIQENDVLVSVFEIDGAGGDPILPDELTGILGLQVAQIIPNPVVPGLPETATILFQAYTGGLDALIGLGTSGKTVAGGGAGGGAVAAMWLDPTPNLDIAADNLPIPPGTFSCSTLSDCIDQAVDGGDFAGNDNPWQVDGFAGDGDELWISTGAALDTSVVLLTLPASELGAVNGAMSILDNGTGQNLGQVSCVPFCGPGAGADGLIDVSIGGSIKGGLGLPPSLIDDGVVATSDFDFSKVAVGVPEPSTLALLAAGFLSIGVAQQRRRRKAGGA